MKRSIIGAALLLGGVALLSMGLSKPAQADGILDYFHPANHKYKVQEPYKPNLGHHNVPTMTMVQLANVIDILEHDLREDGTLVIQQPSVWGQARMTTYRKDFDTEMKNGIGQFKFILSARVARSDQATLQSQTSLAASLGGTPAAGATPPAPISLSDLAKANSDMLKNAKDADPIQYAKAFSLLDSVFKNIGMDNGQLGVEPTIFLDEKKRYLDHLNEIRRINMGDDTADSAGYGLYLVRMPVSIEPGQKTDQGHGAMLSVTAEHYFHGQFLQRTYRNLVINDLVDQLTPILFNILDHNRDIGWKKKLEDLDKARQDLIIATKLKDESHQFVSEKLRTTPSKIENVTQVTDENKENTNKQTIQKLLKVGSLDNNILKVLNSANIAKDQEKMELFTGLSKNLDLYQDTQAEIIEKAKAANNIISPIPLKEIIRLGPVPATIVNGKAYPVAPSDKLSVFIQGNVGIKETSPSAFECLARFVTNLRDSQNTERVRSTDVRTYLQHELEAAYDIMLNGIEGTIPLGNTPVLNKIVTDFQNRSFYDAHLIGSSTLENDFRELMQSPFSKVGTESMGFLCWAIAVDAALLNDRLRSDIERLNGQGGFHCSQAVQNLYFYLPAFDASRTMFPGYLDAEQQFMEYVKVRWPLIAFSLDPVVDQQNIADALSIRRDLQLAVAFAFSTGQIGFNQMISFHRQISLDAETIALNRTVTCFSHGNDTFGWRFTPRYQNPPTETNAHAIGSLLVRGGPGPHYQMNKSQLERGQRELTAVIVMPSFLNTIRMDVRGNYFKLTHPENLTISSGRMLEQGRFVKDLLETNDSGVCDANKYRMADLKGLHVKLEQVEKMLPMHEYKVNVPYENTLGGFDLFVPGTTALVPILAGYDGIDQVNPSAPDDAKTSQSCFFLYGKHFSVLETKVLAGGRYIPDTDVEILSREVMRVRIAKDVQPTKIKENRSFVEVQVATPNGISNRVLIPILPAKSNLMELQTKTLQALVSCDKDSSGKEAFGVHCATPTQIALDWKAPAVASSVKLKFILATNKDANFTLDATIAKNGDKQTATIDTNKDFSPKLADPIFKKIAVTDPISFKITVVSVDGQSVTDDSGIVADPLAVTVTQCTVLPIAPTSSAPAKLPLMELQTKAVTVLVDGTKAINSNPEKIMLAWKSGSSTKTANLIFSLVSDKTKNFKSPATVKDTDNSVTVEGKDFRNGLTSFLSKLDSVPATFSLNIAVDTVTPDIANVNNFNTAVADALTVTVFKCPPPLAKLPLMELKTKDVTVMVDVTDPKNITVPKSNPEKIVLAWKSSASAKSVDLTFSLTSDKKKNFPLINKTIDKEKNTVTIEGKDFRDGLKSYFTKFDGVTDTISMSISVNKVDDKAFDAAAYPTFTADVDYALNITVFDCSKKK